MIYVTDENGNVTPLSPEEERLFREMTAPDVFIVDEETGEEVPDQDGIAEWLIDPSLIGESDSGSPPPEQENPL